MGTAVSKQAAAATKRVIKPVVVKVAATKAATTAATTAATKPKPVVVKVPKPKTATKTKKAVAKPKAMPKAKPKPKPIKTKPASETGTSKATTKATEIAAVQPVVTKAVAKVKAATPLVVLMPSTPLKKEYHAVEWPQERLDELKRLVAEHGVDWSKIGNMMGVNRVAARYHYVHNADPTKFSELHSELSQQVEALVAQHGAKWYLISDLVKVPRKQVMRVYEKEHPELYNQTSVWKDNNRTFRMMQLVRKYGADWTTIAPKIGVSAAAVKQHYRQNAWTFDPTIFRRPMRVLKLAEATKQQIVELVPKHNMDWEGVAAILNVTPHAVEVTYRKVHQLQAGDALPAPPPSVLTDAQRVAVNKVLFDGKEVAPVFPALDPDDPDAEVPIEATLRHEWRALATQLGPPITATSLQMYYYMHVSGAADNNIFSPVSPKNKMTPRERTRLEELLNQHGPNWRKLTRIMGEETGKRFIQRVLRDNAPLQSEDVEAPSRSPRFDKEHAERLRELLSKHGRQWSHLRSELGSKFSVSTLRRWTYLMRAHRKLPQAPLKDLWSNEARELLGCILDKQPGIEWSQVAALMGYQYRLTNIRNFFSISPSFAEHRKRRGEVLAVEGRWTPEEDERLLSFVHRYGKQYRVIGAHMGMTASAVKAHYAVLVKDKKMYMSERDKQAEQEEDDDDVDRQGRLEAFVRSNPGSDPNDPELRRLFGLASK